MIIVYNTESANTLGFNNIESYMDWIEKNPDWDFWADDIYDIGDGGPITANNKLDIWDRLSELDSRRRAQVATPTNP